MSFALLSSLELLLAMASPVPAWSQSCSVPSAPYPTIQSAIDEPSCTEILLAAQTFEESVVIPRDLTMRGASSTTTIIEGQVEVTAGAVTLESMRIDTSVPSLAGLYAEVLDVRDGAQLIGIDLVARNGSMLFGDGIETGDTSRWSSTAP